MIHFPKWAHGAASGLRYTIRSCPATLEISTRQGAYQSGRTLSLVTSPGRIDATEAHPTSFTSSTPSTEQHLSPVKMSGATVDHTQSIFNGDADSELS